MNDKQGTTGQGQHLDNLTGLPERDQFYRDVEALLADKAGGSAFLVVIDVYGVDFILRMFGPADRNAMVEEVAARIRQDAGKSCYVYHITQGRFAVLAINNNLSSVRKLTERLNHSINEPCEVSGIPYYLNSCIGVARYPHHANSIEGLVRCAVFSSHLARENNLSFYVYDKKLDEQERSKFLLLKDLEKALEETGQINAHYQPQVDMQSGRCLGVEALCRWTHPEKGYIAPVDFLPYVEKTPLIMPLTEAMLSMSIADSRSWEAIGFTGYLGINLSPALFRDNDLVKNLLDNIAMTELARVMARLICARLFIIAGQPHKLVTI